MTYSSIEFIFFLAFGLWAYNLMASPYSRTVVLAGLSLFWYWTWSPRWPLILLAIVAFNYWSLRIVDLKGGGRKKICAGLVALDVLILIGLKALPMMSGWTTPYGTSFFMCTLIGLVVDLWRGGMKEGPESFFEFLLFVLFFPVLMAGPIERYRHLGSQLKKLGPLSVNEIFAGTMLFFLGVLKIKFVATVFREPVALLFQRGGSGWLTLFIGGILSTFQAYVEFSGFCDIGRGAARLFGISLETNFRPIYFLKDPNDFWKRWNITLGTWIRDYFTLPMMLRFGRLVNRYVLLIGAFLIVGLWHGFAWHWLVFGLFNGVIISLFFFLQNSPLGKRRVPMQCVGWLMAMLLVAGNGILQHPDSLSWLGRLGRKDVSSHEAWAGFFSAFRSHPTLLPAIIAVVIIDYIQERGVRLSWDFRGSVWWKAAGAFAVLACMIYLLNHGPDYWQNGAPPLYFTF